VVSTAIIERVRGVPDVLVVTGDDLYRSPTDVDPRPGLRHALYRQSPLVSPVHAGSHDFWITYAVPDPGPPDLGLPDPTRSPRPLRGVVRVGAPPALTDPARMAEHLRTLLQQVGRHWLVDPDRFALGPPDAPLAVDEHTHSELLTDRSFSGVPLVGRAGLGWSAYLQADGSPMDGQHWEPDGSEWGWDRWRWKPPPAVPLRPPGLDPVGLTARYSDLDLLLMGAKDSDECYRDAGGTLQWMEPRWVGGRSYTAGLFVAFGRHDAVHAGIDGHPAEVGARRTSGEVLGRMHLGPAYLPAGTRNSGVALRIVRTGDRYWFQARHDDSALRPTLAADRTIVVGAPPETIPGAFDRVSLGREPASALDFTDFRTVATWTDERPPVAVGIIVRDAGTSELVDVVFCNLEVLERAYVTRTDGVTQPLRGMSRRQVHHLDDLPGRATRLDDLDDGELQAHVPAAGPVLRPWVRRLRIQLPASPDGLPDPSAFRPPFDHSTSVDGAPKLARRAPQGDFAVATSLALWQAVPAAASPSRLRGATLWGRTRSLPVDQVHVHDGPHLEVPPDRTFRTAFVLAGRRRELISDRMVRAIDTTRRYWDAAFSAATEGRRRSDSHLPR
jgi:hypothetical protein